MSMTLENIIYEVQSDRNDFSNANYMRMLQWLVRGLTDININYVNNIEVAYLEADSSGFVQLPDDCEDYLKIGICVNGLIQVFGLNENLCLRRKTDCEISPTYTSQSIAINGDLPFVEHYRNGVYITGLYGISGGFRNTYFRIDKKLRRLVLGGDIPLGEIILEYVSSGINVNGNTYIDKDYREVLIALLHYRLAQHAPSNTISMAEKQEAKDMYYYELKKLSRLRKQFTLTQLMDVIYSGYKQTVKR